MSRSEYHRKEAVIVAIAAAAFAAQSFCCKRSLQGTRIGAAYCNRSRHTVEDIWICLGDYYFRRAFCTSYHSFWRLHAKLEDGIKQSAKDTSTIDHLNK